MSRELLENVLYTLKHHVKANSDHAELKVIDLKKKIGKELSKPDPEPLCASCKAIGAAYAIGKESK